MLLTSKQPLQHQRPQNVKRPDGLFKIYEILNRRIRPFIPQLVKAPKSGGTVTVFQSAFITAGGLQLPSPGGRMEGASVFGQ
jgi:hypothetical protein